MKTAEKEIGKILIDFYDQMKAQEKITDYQEREGKKATLVIMAINDLAQFSQQPTEKDAEWQLCPKCGGAGKLANMNGTALFVTCDMCNGQMRLIKPTLQSDSVDAKEFLENKGILDDKVRKPYLSDMAGTTKQVDIRISDLLTEFAGLSSKVKPVNENLRKVLEETLPFVANYENIRKKVESALSTAPDDGWIPVEKELPKEGVYLVYYKGWKYPTVTSYMRINGELQFNPPHTKEKVTHWQPLPSPPKV